jgi:hypothetical protein
MRAVEAGQNDLDNTDKEMVVLKAVLWFLLGQSEEAFQRAELVNKSLQTIESLSVHVDVLEDGECEKRVKVEDLQTANAILKEMRVGYRSLSELTSYTDRLIKTAMQVVGGMKSRADTKVKLSDVKGLEYFMRLAVDVRDVLNNLNLDEEQLEVFDEEMQRRVYGPNRINPPRELN